MKSLKPSLIDDIEARDRAKKELSHFLQTRPEVKTFTLIEGLKVSEKSWVFKAKVNGEKVAIKRFFGEDFPHTVRSLKGELDFLETALNDSKYQANRCLFSWPDAGIVVLSFAPGGRLDAKIAGTSGGERRRLLTQSGEWLRHYCASRQRKRAFGPRFWTKKLFELSLTHITAPQDLKLLENLLVSLNDQADKIAGVEVVQAATHGDFVGMNAHFHKGVIYGVDIQGACWIAIAKDAARFLVWLQIHDAERPSARRYGIDTEYVDPFLKSGVIAADEQATTLPFFVGEQLYERYVENYARRDQRANTRAAIDAYLRLS